jgi:cell division protein ZapA
MSEVTLQVGGRAYPVSCADGEEDHVRRLAAIIDGKLASLGSNLMPGDAKNLLFAALILADEVEEARRQDPAPPAPLLDEGTVRRLDAIAGRIESLAQLLEG